MTVVFDFEKQCFSSFGGMVIFPLVLSLFLNTITFFGSNREFQVVTERILSYQLYCNDSFGRDMFWRPGRWVV